MALRKLSEEKFLYELDFSPKTLIPIRDSENGIIDDSCYAILGDDGKRAPVYVFFHNNRHPNFGLAFGVVVEDNYSGAKKGDMFITTNIQVVAALCKLYEMYRYDEKTKQDIFNARDVDELADKGFSFPIPSIDEAKHYMASNGYPTDGYDTANQWMGLH